jgi:hypothetical protein
MLVDKWAAVRGLALMCAVIMMVFLVLASIRLNARSLRKLGWYSYFSRLVNPLRYILHKDEISGESVEFMDLLARIRFVRNVIAAVGLMLVMSDFLNVFILRRVFRQ